MKNTKISVIIPNWNGAKILEAVIKSCLNQTLQPLEILICDDGSTDNSKEVVEKINNERVIWVPSQHSGTPAIPRNNGIKISKGEWIAFCDNDDEWFPTKLEKQISIATKFKCLASCTNALIKINNILTSANVSNWKKETISFENLLKSNDIVCSSALIHKSIISQIGKFSELGEHRSFADYIYWLRVATLTNFAFINESLVIYDDHPETSIRSDKISDLRLKKISFDNLILWMAESKKNIIKIFYFKYKIKLYLIKKTLKKIIKSVLGLKIKNN